MDYLHTHQEEFEDAEEEQDRFSITLDDGSDDDDDDALVLGNDARRRASARDRIIGHDDVRGDDEDDDDIDDRTPTEVFEDMTHDELMRHQLRRLGLLGVVVEDDDDDEDGDEEDQRARRKRRSCLTVPVRNPEDYRAQCILDEDLKAEKEANETDCCWVCLGLQPREGEMKEVSDIFTQIMTLFYRQSQKNTKDVMRDILDQYNKKLYLPLKDKYGHMKPLEMRHLRRHFQRKGGCGYGPVAFGRYCFERDMELSNDLYRCINHYNTATGNFIVDHKAVQSYQKTVESADRWRRLVDENSVHCHAGSTASATGQSSASSAAKGRKRGASSMTGGVPSSSGAGGGGVGGGVLEETRRRKTLSTVMREQRLDLDYYG